MASLVAFSVGQLHADEIARPPQFVMLAFDNCTELTRWQDLTDFAAAMDRDGKRVRFTFFVSGVNFIANAFRDVYAGPGQRRGGSNIGFGGTADEVRQRVDDVNALYQQGHEIASHALGHFSGRGWSAGDWGKEFTAYRDVLANVGTINGLGSDVKLAFPASAVIGFRAPYLDTSPALYPALKANGFRYDTSGDSAPDAWPEKIDGIWRFNLARLRLHGTGKNILSMDYNFFIAQSRGAVEPQRRAFFRQQAVATYLDYFKSNYAGNRAPLNIGHHFFDYQDGAYKEALMSFARLVCGLPEVRCITYAALADYMDQQSATTLAAFRNGDFAHAIEPALSVAGL
jgi:peptidoglycan/xylan/chitin deacetylase (PgdA/CDA1 family)